MEPATFLYSVHCPLVSLKFPDIAKVLTAVLYNSPPISMMQMEKIFSELVFGETFPKPTLVRLLKVKYRAVTYLSLMEGPDLMTESLYGFPSCSPRLSNQPIPAEVDRSTLPMAYLE